MVVNEENVQKIADLIISINFFYEEIADHKMNINYLTSLTCNGKGKYEVDNENFKFESFDIPYLEKALEEIKKEEADLRDENEKLSSEVDQEDYK